MKPFLITISILLFSLYPAPKKETLGKTYYYYLEISKKEQNSDYSYDIIFSEVKSASCDWDNTSKYGYGRNAIDHIAIAFDQWFEAQYSNPYGYNIGFDAFGNKRLYGSRSEAESARNEAIADYRNSSVKYNIRQDNRFVYSCK